MTCPANSDHAAPTAICACAAFVKIALCLALAGCSAPPKRYLSLEADQQMRELCAARGCIVVPVPQARTSSEDAQHDAI